MNGTEHDRSLLGAYVLGALDEVERQAVEAHVAYCPACRAELADLLAMEASLGSVPPEAFLDGPPEGGDLLLQRTLRVVRTEKARARRWRGLGVAAGITVLAAATLGAGMLIGKREAGQQVLPPPATTAAVPSGARTVSGADQRSGATMTATIVPSAGWVRVHAKVAGIKAGKRCVLVVVPRSGPSVIAGSWLVSTKGEENGTELDGSALVAPNDVVSVDVVTFEGERLISVPA